MKEVSLVKEGEDSYIAFYRGAMIPLRAEDTVEHLYAEIMSLEKKVID